MFRAIHSHRDDELVEKLARAFDDIARLALGNGAVKACKRSRAQPKPRDGQLRSAQADSFARVQPLKHASRRDKLRAI